MGQKFLQYLRGVNHCIGSSALKWKSESLNVSLSASLDGSHDAVWIGLTGDGELHNRVDQFLTILRVLVADSLIDVIDRIGELAGLGDDLHAVHDGWLIEETLSAQEVCLLTLDYVKGNVIVKVLN